MTLPATLLIQPYDWFLINFKVCEWDPLNGNMKGAKDRLKVFKL